VHRGGVLVGYQVRCLDDTKGGPKYITVTQPTRWKEHYFISDASARGGTVVIVEDMFSAIKVGRHLPAIALLGTELKDMLALTMFDKYLIWLDNDKATVKVKQAKIKRRLDLLGECAIIKTPLDPKDYTDEEIRAWLCLT
jgi:DNA primase